MLSDPRVAAQLVYSKANYRPIDLASVSSKLVEVIMLDRIAMYVKTNPNKFGFKRKHGTDQCIYVPKEIIDLYRSGIVFVCFLDANKAFDRVNHRTCSSNWVQGAFQDTYCEYQLLV